ncbi:MAG: hypothetical protein CME67_00745 [Halobacteriovoraceae bacterium]|nr:hypothetical protein [Halobacteriovoraceae bacterium]
MKNVHVSVSNGSSLAWVNKNGVKSKVVSSFIGPLYFKSRSAQFKNERFGQKKRPSGRAYN